ncbi:MAG: hypothetical protein V4437_02725 [Patescibacteria group bacterium]
MSNVESYVVRKETTRTGTAYQVFINGILHLLTLRFDGSTRRVTHLGGGAKDADWSMAEDLAKQDRRAFRH